MKITALKTIKLEQYPNILWLQILTDEGAIGLGETFYGTEPIISYLHETCAPYLIGKNPLDIEKHNHYLLNSYLGFNSVGVETRAASAVDICLWDLFGKITNQPIYQLLGGASNYNIPVYLSLIHI